MDSSAFQSFKSKKILRSSSVAKPSPSDQIPRSDPMETPATPLRRPRRCLMSVKEVREAAVTLRSGKKKPDPVEVPSGLEGPTRKTKKKGEGSICLQDKYEKLCNFFNSMHSSLRLLRMKGQKPSHKNISSQIECLMGKRFSIAHLAQLKFILPEVIELKKVLVHDERTSCMKPDLHVTMNIGAIINDGDSKNVTGNFDIKSIFRSRVIEFVKAHPEEDIPEGPLPEPFNRSNINLNIISEKASSSTSLNETSTEINLQQPAIAASHLPNIFKKHFSKQVSSQTITEFISKPVTEASIPISRIPETPIKAINHVEKKVFMSEGTTPSKDTSTPGKSMSATPALSAPKRCFMTPDENSTNSTNKLVRRPLRSRSLKFDTPVKNAKNEDLVKSSAGDLSSDDDVFDILPKSLVQSIREKEMKIQEDNDPAISQAKRRQQMIANLPKLFDMIRFSFQSSKSRLITKEELFHKLMTTQLDFIDRKEVEEQIVILKELVPDLIYEKLASSGDLLIGINKILSPELIRARLVQEK